MRAAVACTRLQGMVGDGGAEGGAEGRGKFMRTIIVGVFIAIMRGGAVEEGGG